jgi:hypothetical protein
MKTKHNSIWACPACGASTYRSRGGYHICSECGHKLTLFEKLRSMPLVGKLFGRAGRPISQPHESAIATNGPKKALLLRDWAYHSKSVAALVALGPSDGSSSLASKNSAIWAAARSAEEQQVMLFVVLSAATLVLIKHNKTGDGVAALLGAMNVVDGIPDFAPLVVAYRHAIAALQDIEQHQGHKDESKRNELLQKSQGLEKNWGELAAALLKKFGGRSFLE